MKSIPRTKRDENNGQDLHYEPAIPVVSVPNNSMTAVMRTYESATATIPITAFFKVCCAAATVFIFSPAVIQRTPDHSAINRNNAPENPINTRITLPKNAGSERREKTSLIVSNRIVSTIPPTLVSGFTLLRVGMHCGCKGTSLRPLRNVPASVTPSHDPAPQVATQSCTQAC